MEVGGGPVTLETWESVPSSLIGEVLDQRSLFLLHERNQAVLERLHHKDRVRMSCSFGAVFGVLLVGVDASERRSEVVVPLLRDALHDLLASPRP